MQGCLNTARNLAEKPPPEVILPELDWTSRRWGYEESFGRSNERFHESRRTSESKQGADVLRKKGKETGALIFTVSLADLKVSDDPSVTIVTHALGSCIGLAVHDPVAKVGGMLHYQLPESMDPDKAKKKPLMFADTGIPLLFKACYKLGAKKARMIVKVAGGAQLVDANGVFNIGKRNYAALRKIFWHNNVLIDAEDVGGKVNRTMRLSIATGELTMKVSGQGFKVL